MDPCPPPKFKLLTKISNVTLIVYPLRNKFYVWTHPLKNSWLHACENTYIGQQYNVP